MLAKAWVWRWLHTGVSGYGTWTAPTQACPVNCCGPTSCRSVHKSLERATSDRVLDAMLGRTERCFRDPTPEELDALDLEGMRQAVSQLLVTGGGG